MSQLSPGLEIRPVIGIPTDSIVYDGMLRHWLRDTYVSAVLEAGGAPLLIPCTGDEAATYAIYRTLDGLLLSGGGDLNPAYFNEGIAGTEADGIQPHRDSTELMLARWALADDLPMLGICRGHQVINVAAGGSLYQDIPSYVPQSELDHRGSTHTHDRSVLAHSVSFEAGCKLSAIFGTSEIQVNSLHHQSVNVVGKGLRSVGTSPDGLNEALEGLNNNWLVTVQWHPEELWRKHSEAARLFQAFVEATKAAISPKQAGSLTLAGV